MKDYAEQILDGEGENDYTRYMRTDALLSLQRGPGEWVHRDEMLFQIVHQSTELWLKLACAEVAEATRRIEIAASWTPPPVCWAGPRSAANSSPSSWR